MSWDQFTPLRLQRKTVVTLSYAVTDTKGIERFSLSMPTTMAGPWDAAERVNVFWGRDEHAGKLMLQPAADGAFKLRRLRFAVTIAMGKIEGIWRDNHSSPVDHEWQGDALVVGLPGWALGERPPGLVRPRAEAADAAAGEERTERLEVKGNVFISGRNNIMLSPKEALLVAHLVQHFGKPRSKEQLHHVLYGGDPDGGAGTKVLDVYLHKIRQQIKACEVEIITHWNNGYQMVMRGGAPA